VRVKRYIEGADEVAAHGTRGMPMWGDLFRSLSRDTAQIRVQALGSAPGTHVHLRRAPAHGGGPDPPAVDGLSHSAWNFASLVEAVNELAKEQRRM
jgi:hypothetical protein